MVANGAILRRIKLFVSTQTWEVKVVKRITRRVAPSRPCSVGFVQCLIAALLCCMVTTASAADVPQVVAYQGWVQVAGSNYNGAANFKFAIVNAAGDTTYWSHDGTSTGGAQPSGNAVTLQVTDGLFRVLLGDTSVANMNALTQAAFAQNDAHLKVWFDDGVNGAALLGPAQRLAAMPFALRAQEARGVDSTGASNGQVLTADGTGGTTWTTPGGTGGGGDAQTLDGLDSTDLLNRANHTGTQTAATISDFNTAVDAAGAVMDSDISEAEGFIRKTGVGTYQAVKTNLSAGGGPGTGDDSSAGYAVGSVWIDTANDRSYVAVDVSLGTAVWLETGAGATGEANTGANVGTAGVGVFDGKVGSQLQFKNVASADAAVVVTDDAGNNEVDISIDETQLAVATTTTTGAMSAADKTKLDGIESGATADMTDAEIKAAYENNTNTNAFTDGEQTKLAGIEDNADVTDAANVDAAGAVMDSNFLGTEGIMRKTGAGAYVVMQTNLAATGAPGTGDDSGAGYVVGSLWIDVTNDRTYICVDDASGAAVWLDLSAVSGGDANTLDGIDSTGFASSSHAAAHLAGGSDALAWGTIHGIGLDAAKPAAGASNDGYLYVSTDIFGGTLYRSNGTAWVQVARGVSEAATPGAHATSHEAGGSDALAWTTIHGIGLDAARPAAGSSNNGYLYVSTDINGGTIYRSNGTAWVQVSRGVTAAPETHAASHQHGGSDEIATATPAANAIPKADAAGDLDAWVSAASETVPGIVELAADGETTAGLAVQGNDARLSDARAPTGHAASHQHGGSDEIATATPAANAIPKADAAGDLDAWVSAASETVPGIVELAADGETTAGLAVQGNDARLSDARAPTGHAASHQHGGSDEIATATPAANAIPKADAAGDLDAWVSTASETVPGIVELAADGEATAGLAVQGNDARLSDARAPTGTAGGDLSGSYPNPAIAPDAVALGTDTTGNYIAAVTAGDGLTGDTAGEGSTATLAVGAGDGIAVTADAIAVDSSVVRTTTDQSIAGVKTFTTSIATDTIAENTADNGVVVDGVTLKDGGLTATGLIHRASVAGITASPTQTQGQQPLTGEINQISTVTTAGDVVTLPPAVAGERVTVINDGANSLQIFPASGDAISGSAVDLAVTIAAGTAYSFTSYDATTWVRDAVTATGGTFSGSIASGQVAYGTGADAIGGSANMTYDPTLGTGGLAIANTTASTTATTGALTVAGGVGVAGNVTLGDATTDTVSVSGELTATQALRAPVHDPNGTTADPATAATGHLRYNADIDGSGNPGMEFYNGSAWVPVNSYAP